MTLSPQELGEVVRQRRLQLGRKQIEVVEAAQEALGAKAVSEPTYRSIERGRGNPSDLTLAAVSRGLDWPAVALANIRDEKWSMLEVPKEDAPVRVSSSDDIDWHELAELDPAGYAALEAQARLLRDRAKGRVRESACPAMHRPFSRCSRPKTR